MDKQNRRNAVSHVTADDVAAAAGVSRWTVARAFKRNASISEKNRTKVLAAAESLGYVPDLHASGLASARTHLVALLVDDFENPHKLITLNHLTSSLQAAGFGVLLINIGSSGSAANGLLTASQRRVDAAILIGTQFSDDILDTALGAQRLKKLIIFARLSEHPSTVSISCDDEAAIVEMHSYMMRQGYRRPIFLAGPNAFSAILRRQHYFVREHVAAGFPKPPIHYVGRYSPTLARQVLKNIFENTPKEEFPDLIFCENDALAFGAIDMLRSDLGLRVPEDVAVTGFDDVDLAASPTYDLTSYRQPIPEMTQALIEMLRSGNETTENVTIKGQFVPRSSA